MKFLEAPSLTWIFDKLKIRDTNIRLAKCCIKIEIDLQKIPFLTISPLLYLLLNKFENFYLIRIDGVPFCLMPDAVNHLTYQKKPGVHYQKDSICKKCKYASICPGWFKGAQNIKRPPAVPNLPREIVFETTNACNLNCPICFSPKGTQELSFTRIKTLVNECVRLGITNVRFTGGEPLLYPRIIEALQYAKSRKLHVTVNTNATILTKDLESALKNYVDDVLISFQGFNARSEKQLTQSTTDFKEKIHHIVRLNSRIPVVRLGTIMSHTLIKNFPKYHYLIRSLQIKNWELYRPMLKSGAREFQIASTDLLMLMKRIKLKKRQGHDIVIANPVPFCITPDTSLSHHVLVGAEFDDGHSRLVVDTKGFLKPSYLITRNLGPTIKNAWTHPFLKKIRSLDYLPQKCQSCSSLRWCKGGSRHAAHIARGNYFDRDPLMKNI